MKWYRTIFYLKSWEVFTISTLAVIVLWVLAHLRRMRFIRHDEDKIMNNIAMELFLVGLLTIPVLAFVFEFSLL